MKKGDTVQFLGSNYLVTDSEGTDIYEKLEVGEKYQVEEVYILTIQVQGKLFLKENFRKCK